MRGAGKENITNMKGRADGGLLQTYPLNRAYSQTTGPRLIKCLDVECAVISREGRGAEEGRYVKRRLRCLLRLLVSALVIFFFTVGAPMIAAAVERFI